MEKENLRPEDLMVGDWFRFRYTIDGKEIVKTFRISRIVDDIGHVWGDGFGCMCKPERLEPIPLTPEILEKNGFENQGYFSECILGDWRILCDTKNLAIIHREHYNMDTPIEYVHELQHCLKLVGIDKEIVL